MNLRKTIPAALMTLSAFGFGCAMSDAQPKPAASAPASSPAAATPAVSEATMRGTVRSIELPEVLANMPAGPGLEAVTTYCAMCHTPAYIMLQPPLSQEKWTAEVVKMRTTFSGPIPEEKVPEIVAYLVAANGDGK